MDNEQKPLDKTDLHAMRPVITRAIYASMVNDEKAPREALSLTFSRVFGEGRSAEERVAFLLFASPIARQITIELAIRGTDQLGDTEISAAGLKSAIAWMTYMDHCCIRVIDLHYFAGLDVFATATALGLSPRRVVRDLRFARVWIAVKATPKQDADGDAISQPIADAWPTFHSRSTDGVARRFFRQMVWGARVAYSAIFRSRYPKPSGGRRPPLNRAL